MILIYQNTVREYFYTVDFKNFIDILIREIEMNRSCINTNYVEFNQYLIMMILKEIVEKDWWLG